MARMEMSHDEVRELIAPYVLGSLPPEEVSFVRAHILSCDECMAEADSYSDVAASLALSVEPASLSPGFSDRVLDAARGSEVAATEPPRRGRWAFRPLTALVGTAVVLVIGMLSFSLTQTRTQLSDYQDVVSALLHSEGGFDLTGNGAVGRVVPAGDGSVFVVAGMRKAPDNHTYQLWLIDGGEPVSAGIFDVEAGVALLENEHSLEGFQAAAVTIEPAGGSSEPTTDPILTSG